MVALGSDHAGFPLKTEIKNYLDSIGVEYKDFGCYTPERFDYAIAAQKACDAVMSGECNRAILCCGTGVGISMAANKVKGIRAALCNDVFSAKMSREHNDANILGLGGRVLGFGPAGEIVKAWLSTPFSGDERHQRRIDKMMALENK